MNNGDIPPNYTNSLLVAKNFEKNGFESNFCSPYITTLQPIDFTSISDLITNLFWKNQIDNIENL